MTQKNEALYYFLTKVAFTKIGILSSMNKKYCTKFINKLSHVFNKKAG